MFKKFWMLAVCLLLPGLALALGPGLALAGPPLPGQQVEALEDFWQEMYGPQVGPQLVDEFIGTLDRQRLAKAQPDECYDGIGQPYPPGPPCDGGGVPKVNQAYVWGLAKAGHTLWFGTAPNVHCLVLGALMDNLIGLPLPHETDAWVCEFDGTTYPSPLDGPLPPAMGDWRPPKIYAYDLSTQTLTDKLVRYDPWLTRTLGIRSAGSLDNVVILAGPDLEAGLNLFAFNTTNGDFLGSTNLPAYDNIRKWRVVQGVLYTAVGNSGPGGAVLRWTGSAAAPFQFQVVGLLDGAGAELAAHDGRLFVTTWPDLGAGMAGLYMSPLIPAGGLTNAHAAGWTKVWRATDYDPDPVTAATYGGGALASFGGDLYWGTMHVPFLSTAAHMAAFSSRLQALDPDRVYPDSPEEMAAAFLGPYRAISIFRGRDFGTPEETQEVLYGAAMLPAPAIDYTVEISDSGTITTTEVVWSLAPTPMGPPLLGPPGFGNFFNNYTWTMEPYHNQLYVGTMDWSYLADELIEIVLEGVISSTVGIPMEMPPQIGAGADLWRFPATGPAVPESIEGVGNYANYGIRTMLVDDALYLGTANPMNLLADPAGDTPQGGWELIRLAGDSRLHLPLIMK